MKKSTSGFPFWQIKWTIPRTIFCSDLFPDLENEPTAVVAVKRRTEIMSLGICCSDLLFLCSPHSFQMRMHHRVSLCVDIGTAAFLASVTTLSDNGAASEGVGLASLMLAPGWTSAMSASMMSSVSLSDSGSGCRLHPLGTTKLRRWGVSGHAREDILIVRDSNWKWSLRRYLYIPVLLARAIATVVIGHSRLV